MKSNVPESELLSAYLDGELTAAEQAAVEQLLAQSPAARQLVDDLRALSATLQSLPAHKLEMDLSQEVLQIAGRRMLSEPRELAESAEPPGAGAAGEPPFRRTILRRALSRRNLAWSAVAVAAAVLIWAMNPEFARREREPREKHVAMVPKDGAPAVAKPSFVGAAEEADEAMARRHLAEAKSDRGGAVVSPAAGRPAEIAKTAPVAKMLAPAKDEPGPPAGERTFARSAAPARGRGAGAPSTAGMPLVAKSPAATEGPPPAAPPPGAMADQMKVPAGMDREGGRVFKFGQPQSGGFGGAGAVPPVVGKQAEEPVVVLCELTPEAVRDGAFERIVSLGANVRQDKKEPASGERSIEVELTQAQLDGVLDSLKKEPQLFPLVLTGNVRPSGGAEQKADQRRAIGKGGVPSQEALRERTTQVLELLARQKPLETAPLKTPGPAQVAPEPESGAVRSAYGTVQQQAMPGGARWGPGRAGGSGMGQLGPGVRAPQRSFQVQPAAESLAGQLDHGEVRLRVLFVLRQVPETGPAEGMSVAKDRAGKAEAAKPASKAAGANPAAVSPVQPTVPAIQPGPAPAHREAK
jgi:hypothetical protein